MYIPIGSVPLDSVKSPQIRLLLIGRPGAGKTYPVVKTFPNVVVADWDNGLTSKEFKGLGITVLPFNDQDWLNAKFPRKDTRPTIARDAFKVWLNTEARKLEGDQTLFVDSLSTLSDAFHSATENEVPISKKTGEEDGYYLWEQKIMYLRDIHIILKSLKCHVVVSAHEDEERDPKNGILLGKVSPLLSGKFRGRIGAYYTDIFHAETGENKDKEGKPNGVVWYLWQIRPDSRYDLKTRLTLTDEMLINKKYITPGYEIFKQYLTS